MKFFKKRNNLFICILIVIIIIGCFKKERINKKNVQTIVIIRHAEKPKNDLGQLNCKGLNRALALPKYFKNNFPKPDYVFAPKPITRNKPNTPPFYYIRPLMTIEPTAILFNRPVDITIPAVNPRLSQDIIDKGTDKIADELLKQKYRNAVIYVAWEHLGVPPLAKNILNRFNMDSSNLPEWEHDDFDSVYVFEIDWNTNKLSYKIQNQNLNYVSSECPNNSGLSL